jgi:hypothetical protein
MKKIPDKGSVEWFELSRIRCVDHLRALLSIKLARDNAVAILRNWNSLSAETNSALHSSCVIAYARPFTYAATKNGKVTYSAKRLPAASGFDKELHIHILDLRNQIIAHGDYGIFPSTMYLQTVGDERLPLRLGINVKGILGIESHDLALRYEKHLSVCDLNLEKILNHECRELASEARMHPAEFHKTHNIPEVKEEITLGPESKDLPPPAGPAAVVENPVFPEGLSGYRYITLTHQISLIESGKYIVTEDGMAKEMIFTSE